MKRFLEDTKARRLQFLRIDPFIFQAWLKTGEVPHMLLLSEKLPEDATLLGAFYEQLTQTFVLLFQSEHFEPVEPVHGQIPEMESPKWGVLQETES